MKDAKGQGSDLRGAHSAGVNQVGRAPQWGTNKAANVREALRVVQQSGYPAELWRKPGSKTLAIYSNTDGKIYVNASNKFWKDPVGNMVKQGSGGHLSSTSPEHILNHEIGHAI